MPLYLVPPAGTRELVAPGSLHGRADPVLGLPPAAALKADAGACRNLTVDVVRMSHATFS
jgi:hypothetical protein